MKAKKYTPVNFLPVNNETYQTEFDRIFRKGKRKGKGSGKEKEASPFKGVIAIAGGHRKIYTSKPGQTLRDIGFAG